MTTTSTTEGAKDRASCGGAGGEEGVEEISISGSFPCSHAHFSISQLNIIYYEFPPTLDNNLNSSHVMSVNECFQDLIKYKLKINYNHYIIYIQPDYKTRPIQYQQ